MVLQSIPTATAHTGEMDWITERYDYDFKRAVERVIEDCRVRNETRISC